MWIVPKNFSGTYPFVQGIQELGLDSNEFCQLCERSLMSKSKPTRFKTWLTKWNKDSYLQHLCTQTLKPSHSQTFVDAWTSYLAAFPASPSVKPEQEDQQKTHGISSPTLPMESTPVQQDMFSSKTSKESSPPKPLTGKVFSDMSSENWKDCVTRRRGEYSVRQKQAQAIREKEYLSLLQEMESHLMTCSPDTQSQNPPSGQPDLTNNSLNGKSQESSNWPTPTAVEGTKIGNKANYGQQGLSNHPSIVGPVTREKGIKSGKENWATPTTRDYKGSYSPEALVRKDGKSRLDALPQQAQYDETNISKVGKLNPSWVEQLMGLPVQWSMLPEPTSVHRVSRLMLLGNGVVPQQAEVAFRTLLAQADQDHQS